MKFIAPLFVGVLAVFTAQVQANGVCYDPNHGSTMTADSVATDMETIASYGFSSVRTYISKFGTTEMGSIITAAGLTAALGVPYPQSDYEDQMTAAISAANSGGVSYIFVGNENLAGASSVPSAMISVIESVKSQVPDSVQVGTVQRNTEVIGYESISGWDDLVSACDVLGVNVHPFFTSGTTADDAIDVVNTQWETMMSNFGDKLLLTETGWPSSGSYSGNTGSTSGTETFYSDYQSWSSSLSEKFYFQIFDTPYKSESYEQTFGLLTYDSQSKFSMTQSETTTTTDAPETEAPATEAPATEAPATEAPATEAPTTEAPATEAPATETPATETPATETPATETPETDSTSGSAEIGSDYNTTSTSGSSDESVTLDSASGSADLDVGANSTSSSTDQDVGAESDSVESDYDIESVTKKSTSSEDQSTGTTGTSSTGTSKSKYTSGTDGSSSAEDANTQSTGSSASTTVGLAVAGGACAVLLAFGFIYQTRKRAQELEDAEDKGHESFSAITPQENICAL